MFRLGISTSCVAQGQLNECGSAICGGALSLVYRLISRFVRFVAGSRTWAVRPRDGSAVPTTSGNHRAAWEGAGGRACPPTIKNVAGNSYQTSERLDLFLDRANELLAEPAVTEGCFNIQLSFTFSQTDGLSTMSREPTEPLLKSFLLTFRHFVSDKRTGVRQQCGKHPLAGASLRQLAR